ncbi:nicotinamidase-related amidase [Nocardioides ginsengisegetis]|uniref:Nicotinamidase-related amidase n=1 Tax=Nocardioides ginsengisegetis TaxID=661491 RepID=A0A7W3J204_9ACTN|nr:nicotinamidase-related amidase [Nocardioides ginsengisegetis]
MSAVLHEWRIAPREYARHESRRGRRFAHESIVPARTALVVVDVVPFFVEQNPYCAGILPQVRALSTAVRDAGGVVAWVRPTSGPPTPAAVAFYGADVATLYAASGGEPAAEAGVQAGDLHVEKSVPSAFFPGLCDLHDLLAERSVDTVIVTGTVTNVCVESTVRDAATLGYRVVLVADACAAVDDATHNATLHTVYRSFGDVRPTAEVLALLGG